MVSLMKMEKFQTASISSSNNNNRGINRVRSRKASWHLALQLWQRSRSRIMSALLDGLSWHPDLCSELASDLLLLWDPQLVRRMSASNSRSSIRISSNFRTSLRIFFNNRKHLAATESRKVGR